jgi:cephalosporin-C deacetylase-like acetyl esterase
MIRASAFRLSCLVLLAVAAFAGPPADDELDFLKGLTQSTNLSTMSMDALRTDALASIESRGKAIERISGREAFDQRRQMIRARVRSLMGEFPARTPLNARTVSILDRGDYRIEKVIFESQPRFPVTANLYVPQGIIGRLPAVLVPLGHEAGGKANPTWQRLLTTLARKGYVVLTWDPLGQGERVQFWDEDLHDSKVPDGSTIEHTVIHSQSLLLGETVARFFVYDGIRALDYLLSRSEVDPARVAVTGNSGGGTGTAYLAAVDDRFAAAAPSCYITSWKALLASIGPQDGEQVLTGLLGSGLDFPDLVYAAMPKPYLILSAIRDFFPIAGARATYAEIRSTAGRTGLDGVVAMREADDGHGYSRPRREAFYDWLDGLFHPARPEVREAETAPLRVEDLNCTVSGQVASSLTSSVTASGLNLERFRELKARRTAFSLDRVRELIGYAAGRPAPPIVRYGAVSKRGYRIEKLTVETAPGVIVPSLLFVPSGGRANKPVVLYADGAGKSATAGYDELMHMDVAVLAIDLRGMGETGPRKPSDTWGRYFGDYHAAMSAFLLGKSLVSLRANDISRVLDAIGELPGLDASAISARARGAAAVPMLHAAALDARIRALAVEDILVSYESVLTNRIPRRVLEDIVPGAAVYYDLPDLLSSVAPRPVWILSAHDATGSPLSSAELIRTFAGKGAVATGCTGTPAGQLPATDWCVVREPALQ